MQARRRRNATSNSPEKNNPYTFRYQSQSLVFHPQTSTAMNNGYDPTGAADAPPPDLPKFANSEIRLGSVLGQGGFSLVSEVRAITLDEVYEMGGKESELRKALAEESNKEGEGQFVLKRLRDDLPEDENAKGVVDLAIEATFLASLVHPNIINMRATANSDPLESKFFVILDRLETTLDKKMNYWRKIVGENMGYWMGPCIGYCCAKKHALERVWLERLIVCRDIASAIRYLHSQSIVYRDLKPDNVGFDSNNQVKIFDFGLAKRLDPEDKSDDELYMLTGNTGSLRYMAPEVANCEPYDHRVDAYSFGILFWQICSLTTPYSGFSMKMHSDRVVKLGHRPKLEPSWPESWSQLMKECWSSVCYARPDFDHVVRILDAEVAEMMTEDGVVAQHADDIKAKAKKKKAKDGEEALDVDTRISTDTQVVKRKHDVDIV
mmetsp:Transcript_15764/g.24516  ORF Transcript_15764/g.24516 Transcript_15764/m.24516 type:complete len:436 (-) Transcript_15764:237-1544(-)